MRQRLEQMLSEVVRAELTAVLPTKRATAVPLDVVVRFVVGAFLALLVAWLDNDLTGTPAEIDASFRALAEPGVRAVLG